jgi:hypothetical protein
MYVIYVDECGYQVNWADEKAMKEQPVYVVSAVAIAVDSVEAIYRKIRKSIARLNIPRINAHALGRGQEIKASQVDRGEGFWRKYPNLCDKVRKIYLDHSGVTYFVICIDKRRHYYRYKKPEDPANLGLQYLLERIRGFLKEKEEQGLIIIDANRKIEPQHRELLQKLLTKGSEGKTISRILRAVYRWHLEMKNIIEIHFGDSRDSLGLQIADFVARHAYSWWKSGKKKGHLGWSYIEPKLWKYPDYDGYGYKEFPRGR